MNSLGGFAITIITGIIICIVGLILEYGYFKKRRQGNSNSEQINQEEGISSSWTNAVDTALQSLSRNYPSADLRVVKMQVRRGVFAGKARLCVQVLQGEHTNDLYVEIDKAGDVLKFCTWGHDGYF